MANLSTDHIKCSQLLFSAHILAGMKHGNARLQAMGENAIGLIQEFGKVLRDEPDKAAAQEPDDQGMVFFDVLGLFMVGHASRASILRSSSLYHLVLLSCHQSTIIIATCLVLEIALSEAKGLRSMLRWVQKLSDCLGPVSHRKDPASIATLLFAI